MLKDATDLNENYNLSTKPLQYISQHYYVLWGAFFIIIAIINYFINLVSLDYSGYFLLLAFTCFTVGSDINKEIKVKGFLLMAIPFLALILIIFINGNGLWHKVLRWEMGRNIIFNLNSLFNSIPFNDASFARIFQTPWLTSYMKLVYNTGFVLAVIIPLIRAALCIDFKKMIRYALSAHIFQVLIITPFYIVFYLQEVWYVHGISDPLIRHLNPAQTLETTLNCFPSMHTSIAFAMFLLVIRERNKIFKWFWGFYCISVIYSTMYLEIHWVIDVVGGLILGYATVKLVNFIILKTEVPISKYFSNILYKNNSNVTYNE